MGLGFGVEGAVRRVGGGRVGGSFAMPSFFVGRWSRIRIGVIAAPLGCSGVVTREFVNFALRAVTSRKMGTIDRPLSSPLEEEHTI